MALLLLLFAFVICSNLLATFARLGLKECDGKVDTQLFHYNSNTHQMVQGVGQCWDSFGGLVRVGSEIQV